MHDTVKLGCARHRQIRLCTTRSKFKINLGLCTTSSNWGVHDIVKLGCARHRQIRVCTTPSKFKINLGLCTTPSNFKINLGLCTTPSNCKIKIRAVHDTVYLHISTLTTLTMRIYTNHLSCPTYVPSRCYTHISIQLVPRWEVCTHLPPWSCHQGETSVQTPHRGQACAILSDQCLPYLWVNRVT